MLLMCGVCIVAPLQVLDMPLPELEQLKTMKVNFHNERAELVSEQTLRLAKDAVVGELLAELKKVLGAAVGDRPLRLMEVFNSKIYKVRARGECDA